jgi:cysteine desulfurase/selenocysteine lyase
MLSSQISLKQAHPNIVGAIGFGNALDYLNEVGFEKIEAYETELLDYATTRLKSIPNLKDLRRSKK